VAEGGLKQRQSKGLVVAVDEEVRDRGALLHGVQGRRQRLAKENALQEPREEAGRRDV